MRLVRILLISMCLFLLGSNAYSQSKEQVYAGVILHIMKYVEWPAYADKMTVGVVNSPLLVKALQKAAIGKKIHFKNVEVLRFDQQPSLKGVDVLFFSKKTLKGVSPAMVKSSDKGILVIAEQQATIDPQVAINFIQRNGSLQFEMYNKAMTNGGFKVSEQLKKLAIQK